MTTTALVLRSPDQCITRVRGHAVILDSNLAALYGVPVKRLNEQGRRNKERFPENFMFQLTENEQLSLSSQNATLKRGQLDDSRPGNNKTVTGEHLRAAINAVLADQPITVAQRRSPGCNIKWKS